MIAIQSRKEAECGDCFKTKEVYVMKINSNERLVCKSCRDKLIDKFFDSKEDASVRATDAATSR
ncbi:MAG TPA: hypothetical protein VHV55_26575 [Pirellulales bacterium]|nr:hypothetical protein [Pirellulales bacterium]